MPLEKALQVSELEPKKLSYKNNTCILGRSVPVYSSGIAMMLSQESELHQYIGIKIDVNNEPNDESKSEKTAKSKKLRQVEERVSIMHIYLLTTKPENNEI